jgi:Kinesin motor domain
MQECKLTTMLRGAFGGNSRTSAIINCRTDDMHGDETLQSIRFGERCGMISNTTKLAATSLQSAIEAIDSSLSRVGEQLQSLERRGKQHLESFQKLSSSYHLMLRKREDLARSSSEQKSY